MSDDLQSKMQRRRDNEPLRAIDPDTGKPFPMPKQSLKGKLTYIGLIVSASGAVGKLFGWEIPVDEVQGMLGWLAVNWDTLAQFIGLATAAYGRARLNWRNKVSNQ